MLEPGIVWPSSSHEPEEGGQVLSRLMNKFLVYIKQFDPEWIGFVAAVQPCVSPAGSGEDLDSSPMFDNLTRQLLLCAPPFYHGPYVSRVIIIKVV